MQVNFIHVSFTKEKQMAVTNFKEFREVKLYPVSKRKKSRKSFVKAFMTTAMARKTDPKIRLFHLLAAECGVSCLIFLCLFAYSFNSLVKKKKNTHINSKT